MGSKRPRPPPAFLIAALAVLGLFAAAFVFVIGEKSVLAAIAVVLAAGGCFSLARWSKRGGFR